MTNNQSSSLRDMLAKYIAARLRPWTKEIEEFTPENPMYYESCAWADDILQLVASQDLGDVVSKETFDAAHKEWNSQLSQVMLQARDDAETARDTISALKEERDQAISHDRQPYPTAWAYDQACRAIRRYRTMHDEAETRLNDVYDRIRKIADDAHDSWQVGGCAAQEHRQYRDQLLELLTGSTPRP